MNIFLELYKSFSSFLSAVYNNIAISIILLGHHPWFIVITVINVALFLYIIISDMRFYYTPWLYNICTGFVFQTLLIIYISIQSKGVWYILLLSYVVWAGIIWLNVHRKKSVESGTSSIGHGDITSVSPIISFALIYSVYLIMSTHNNIVGVGYVLRNFFFLFFSFLLGYVLLILIQIWRYSFHGIKMVYYRHSKRKNIDIEKEQEKWNHGLKFRGFAFTPALLFLYLLYPTVILM